MIGVGLFLVNIAALLYVLYELMVKFRQYLPNNSSVYSENIRGIESLEMARASRHTNRVTTVINPLARASGNENDLGDTFSKFKAKSMISASSEFETSVDMEGSSEGDVAEKIDEKASS